MKILMMGPQGSGKGTIGGLISEYLQIPLLSPGQLLRDVPKEHPWYKSINEQLNKGVLVDVDKTAEILDEEINKDRCRNGFILDGWYRRMEDVHAYEVDFDRVFLLTISPETTINRLSSRRTCSACGEIYNTITPSERPKVEGVCDKCGAELVQRKDDTREAIMKRLSIYYNDTQNVIRYLKDKNLLVEIDGEGPPAEVFERIKPYLK